MARWRLDISGPGVRKETVQKIADKIIANYGKEKIKVGEKGDPADKVSISITDATPPESRAERFQSAMADINDGRSEIESLKDELESWKESLPENLQDGEKGQQLEEAIDALGDIINDLEQVEGRDVDFPGMY